MSENTADDGQSVDAIRDILFGRQMRVYDERFSQLEQSLEKQLSGLRNDIGEQLGQYKTLQQAQDQGLSDELAGLSDELNSTRQALISSVTDQVDSLRKASVSRQDLATLLRDLADKIDHK